MATADSTSRAGSASKRIARPGCGQWRGEEGTTKKALASVLRLIALVGVLALLPFIGKGPEAQLTHQCVTIYTDDTICPSCCSNPGANIPNDIVSQSSPTGIQSILNTDYSCGTASPCFCPWSCSGRCLQAVSDSGCCNAAGSTQGASHTKKARRDCPSHTALICALLSKRKTYCC